MHTNSSARRLPYEWLPAMPVLYPDSSTVPVHLKSRIIPYLLDFTTRWQPSYPRLIRLTSSLFSLPYLSLTRSYSTRFISQPATLFAFALPRHDYSQDENKSTVHAPLVVCRSLRLSRLPSQCVSVI
ncbi:hypothetical protein QCA50_008301 [Cerrena zonata]|uniref:Uncharacterized protein n=1 Tax=Cerrena zonata TaxID=2478898 RepID=A0AAW0G8K5_9APHY